MIGDKMSLRLEVPRIGNFEFKDFESLKKAINDKDSPLRLKLS